MNKKLLSLLLFLTPIAIFAQEKGLDERINDWFMPKAVWWENLVLTTVPIGEYNVPFVVILLVLGASFFTIYFKFINIRKVKKSIDYIFISYCF